MNLLESLEWLKQNPNGIVGSEESARCLGAEYSFRIDRELVFIFVELIIQQPSRRVLPKHTPGPAMFTSLDLTRNWVVETLDYKKDGIAHCPEEDPRA